MDARNPAPTIAAMKRGRLAAAMAVLIVATPAWAWAFPDDPGTRALAMGGAGRADARGDQGPRLNPSGMSLARLYTVEGGYQFITRDGGHVARVSVVDSTSGSNLAGGLYYSYRTATPAGLPGLVGHEAGLSLSLPLADRAFLGVTGKYVYASGGFAEPVGAAKHSGITADAGVTVRAASFLTIGVVGYNLRDLSTIRSAGRVWLWGGTESCPRPGHRGRRSARFHDLRSHSWRSDHRGRWGRIHVAAQDRFCAPEVAGMEGRATAIWVPAWRRSPSWGPSILVFDKMSAAIGN